MDLLAELSRCKVLAIFRSEARPETGVHPNAGRRRHHRAGAVLLAAGTVVSASQTDEVATAGTSFVVTPAVTRGAHRSVELGRRCQPCGNAYYHP